jgi:hypothetical protein
MHLISIQSNQISKSLPSAFSVLIRKRDEHITSADQTSEESQLLAGRPRVNQKNAAHDHLSIVFISSIPQ